MTQSLSEDDLREAHLAFITDHERLRLELLASLENCRPSPGRSLRKSRGPSWIAMSVSACLAVALLLWISMSGSDSHRVYALDGIEEKFLHIRSIHIKGTSYHTIVVDGMDVEKAIPVEMYAERPANDKPSRYFHAWCGIEDDGNGVRVSLGSYAADGERTFSLDETNKLATRGKSHPLSTELLLEHALQNQWLKQIVHGPSSNYRVTGTENVKGRKALRYESVEERDGDRTRNTIWLNVATGLPIRSAIDKIDASGKEHRDLAYDTIDMNTPPPAAMFNFDPPEGYQFVEEEGVKAEFNVASGGGGNDHTAVRYSFAIDRLAVLVYWYHGIVGAEPTTPEQDPVQPVVEFRGPSGPRKCELLPIRAQLEADKLWRWSLAMPIDRHPVNPDEAFVTEFQTKNHPTRQSWTLL